MHDAIVLHDGQILEGRNRYLKLLELVELGAPRGRGWGQCLRDRQRGKERDRSLDRLLQCLAPAVFVLRQDARRSLCYRQRAGETSSVTKSGIHLSQAANLSQKADPPQVVAVP